MGGGRARRGGRDAPGAATAVAPALAGTAFAFHTNQEIEALLLDAVARTRLGDPGAAERSVERALDLAEPQGHVWIWLTVPGARDLLAAHPSHRTVNTVKTHMRKLYSKLDVHTRADAVQRGRALGLLAPSRRG